MRDVARLEQIMAAESPDYVLHVAGVTKGTSYEDFQVGNVMPTRNLLTALAARAPRYQALRAGLVRGVLRSFGDLRAAARENPPRPVEHYGESKLEAERVVEEEAAEVPWTIVRPCAVYGPGDVDHFALFQAAMLGVNVFYGNRDRSMSWIYVDDCVRGILEAAASQNSKGKGYFLRTNQVHLGQTSRTRSPRSSESRFVTWTYRSSLLWAGAFAGEIASRIDKKPRLLNLQKAKLGAQAGMDVLGDAARTDFGFSAEVDLAEGIRRTHQWYRDNDWYRSLDPEQLLSHCSLRRLVGRLGRGR